MSKLCIALDEYLKMRRALGHKLRLAGGLLPRFVEFANHGPRVALGNAARRRPSTLLGAQVGYGTAFCSAL